MRAVSGFKRELHVAVVVGIIAVIVLIMLVNEGIETDILVVFPMLDEVSDQ